MMSCAGWLVIFKTASSLPIDNRFGYLLPRFGYPLGYVGITDCGEKISEDNPKVKESKGYDWLCYNHLKNPPTGDKKSRPRLSRVIRLWFSMGMALKLKNYATLDLANQSRRMPTKEGRPLRVHRSILRRSLCRPAPAEGVRLLVPCCHLRPVPSGCRRLLSRASV